LTGLSGEKYRYLRQVTINFLEAPEGRQHELWAPIAAVLELTPDEVESIGTARHAHRPCSLALLSELMSDPTALAHTHPHTHAALAATADGARAVAGLTAAAVAAVVAAAPGVISSGMATAVDGVSSGVAALTAASRAAPGASAGAAPGTEVAV